MSNEFASKILSLIQKRNERTSNFLELFSTRLSFVVIFKFCFYFSKKVNVLSNQNKQKDGEVQNVKLENEKLKKEVLDMQLKLGIEDEFRNFFFYSSPFLKSFISKKYIEQDFAAFKQKVGRRDSRVEEQTYGSISKEYREC